MESSSTDHTLKLTNLFSPNVFTSALSSNLLSSPFSRQNQLERLPNSVCLCTACISFFFKLYYCCPKLYLLFFFSGIFSRDFSLVSKFTVLLFQDTVTLLLESPALYEVHIILYLSSKSYLYLSILYSVNQNVLIHQN